MRTVLFLVWKEYLHVLRDRATLVQVLAIPMLQLVVLGFAATFQIRETRMHVVDLDRSVVSRQLVARFEGSGYFRVAGASASVRRADDALMAGDATLVLHVPPGFERDLMREGSAPVQLILNAEQGAAAGIVRAYATGVLADYAAELGIAAGRDPRVRADPGPVPGAGRVEVRTRGWFNPTLDYTHYMVPGILVALVTIIGTLLTAQNIAREKELGTLEQLNVTPVTRAQFIAGKLLPFWILGMAELAVGFVLARLVFQIPVRGSLVLVFAVAAVYLVAALALGLLISTVADTQQQAMFVTFFVMMIYLLMSGLFTPIDSMPVWMQWLAELNPVKHFVHVMRAVLVKGAGPAAILPAVGALFAFAATALLLAVRQHSKRTA
jgi:ABC-2 type transport system permease protein